jgi:hypothetical protein
MTDKLFLACVPCIAVALALFIGPAPAQAQIIDDSAASASVARVENGGIAVEIAFIGRNPDGKRLTVASEIRNLRDERVFVAVIGPPPGAVDNQGVTYSLASSAGIAQCDDLRTNRIQECMRNWSSILPGYAFSSLDPGTSALVSLTFEAPEVSQTGFLSLSLNLAVGAGEMPSNDRSVDRPLDNIAVTFPMIRLSDATP